MTGLIVRELGPPLKCWPELQQRILDFVSHFEAFSTAFMPRIWPFRSGDGLVRTRADEFINDFAAAEAWEPLIKLRID